MVLPPTASESHCLHSLFRRKFNPFSDPPVRVLYFQHHEPYRWEVTRGCDQYPHPAGLRVWDGWAVYQVHRGGSSWNLGYISPNEGKKPNVPPDLPDLFPPLLLTRSFTFWRLQTAPSLPFSPPALSCRERLPLPAVQHCVLTSLSSLQMELTILHFESLLILTW